jgi:hypothetical protein
LPCTPGIERGDRRKYRSSGFKGPSVLFFPPELSPNHF